MILKKLNHFIKTIDAVKGSPEEKRHFENVKQKKKKKIIVF